MFVGHALGQRELLLRQELHELKCGAEPQSSCEFVRHIRDVGVGHDLVIRDQGTFAACRISREHHLLVGLGDECFDRLGCVLRQALAVFVVQPSSFGLWADLLLLRFFLRSWRAPSRRRGKGAPSRGRGWGALRGGCAFILPCRCCQIFEPASARPGRWCRQGPGRVQYGEILMDDGA